MRRRTHPITRWIPICLFLLSLGAVLYTGRMLAALGVPESGPISLHWPRIAETLAWLFGTIVFNQLSRWLLWDTVVARILGAPVPGVLKEIFAVLVYLVSLTCIVGLVWERSVTGFLAALGAGGIVLGFALRDLFADIFTGLAINIDRTFVIGDWVRIEEGPGKPTIAKIREIGWRCTSLVTEEQTTVIVPNSMLGQERLINITQPIEPTRYEPEVTVEFSVPPQRVKRVLLAAIKALAETPGHAPSHEPVVLIQDSTSLGVEYLVRFWILPWHPHSPSTWRDLVMESVLRHLHTAGISLAYPKTDVYHAKMPERQIEGHSVEDEIKLLSKVHLFEPLQAGELEHLVETLHRQVSRAGQTLVRAGEEGDSLFILIEGLLSVKVEQNGRQQQVALIEPGQCFGEMSLLTGERRSATVSCVTESVVYEIRKEPLRHLMEQRPELADHLALILAERQVQTLQTLDRQERYRESEAFDSLARQLLSRMRDFLGSARLRPIR